MLVFVGCLFSYGCGEWSICVCDGAYQRPCNIISHIYGLYFYGAYADPPPTVVKPADVSIIPGDNALFNCLAHSTVDFNLTWLRYNSTLDQYSELAANTEVFANGSLVIR